MNSRILRNFFLLLLVTIILLMALPSVAFAVAETHDMFTLTESQNMSVSIKYDLELPPVSFTAPDGAVSDGYSLRYENGEGGVIFYIPKAAAGLWTITYDRLTNVQFDITYASYMDPITISNFAIGALNENSIPVSFSVSGSSEDSYQWRIFAVVMEGESVVGEHLLLEDGASLFATIVRNVFVDDLSDYPNYQLRLDVWQKKGDEEVFDSRISEETFAIETEKTERESQNPLISEKNPLSGEKIQVNFLDENEKIVVSENLVYSQAIHVLNRRGEKMNEYSARQPINIRLPILESETGYVFAYWDAYYKEGTLILEPMYRIEVTITTHDAATITTLTCDVGHRVTVYNRAGGTIDSHILNAPGSISIVQPPEIQGYAFTQWKKDNQEGEYKITAEYEVVPVDEETTGNIKVDETAGTITIGETVLPETVVTLYIPIFLAGIFFGIIFWVRHRKKKKQAERDVTQ